MVTMLQDVSEALFEARWAEAGDAGFCLMSPVMFELNTSRTSSSEGGEAWLDRGLIGIDSILDSEWLNGCIKCFWAPSGVCPG